MVSFGLTLKSSCAKYPWCVVVRLHIRSGVGDACPVRIAEQEVCERVSAEHAVESVFAEVVAREERDVVLMTFCFVVYWFHYVLLVVCIL